MDFKNMDLATLTRGVSGKGERFLELFLREYTAIFPGPLNPQCPRCLNQYLQQYKTYMNTVNNNIANQFLSPDDTLTNTPPTPDDSPGEPLEGDELFEPNTPV